MAKFEKGKSGNPGGRPAINQTIKELALQYSEAAFNMIVELLGDSDPRIRFGAGKEILDRAYGKPVQGVEHSGNIEISVTVTEKNANKLKS